MTGTAAPLAPELLGPPPVTPAASRAETQASCGSVSVTPLDVLSNTEQGVDAGFLRDGLRPVAQELMDAEVPNWSAPGGTSGTRPG